MRNALRDDPLTDDAIVTPVGKLNERVVEVSKRRRAESLWPEAARWKMFGLGESD